MEENKSLILSFEKNSDDYDLRKISELSLDELKQLTYEYENSNDSVEDLIKKYRIKDLRISQLKSALPRILTDTLCPYCKQKMYRIPQRHPGKNYKPICYCPNCGHETSNFCNCQKCAEKREQEEIIKQQALEKERQENAKKIAFFLENLQPHKVERSVNFNSLSFSEQMFISSLCNFIKFTDKNGTFEFIDERLKYDKIAPSLMFDKINAMLFDKNIIIKDPFIKESDCFVKDGEVFVHDLKKESFILTLKDFSDPSTFNENLDKIVSCEFASSVSSEEICNFWKELAFSECVENLQYEIEPFDDTYQPSTEVASILYTLLENYSPAVVCCLIWASCNCFVNDFARGKIDKLHGRIYAIGRIKYNANALISGKKNYKPSWRKKEIIQSVISILFYKNVLKLSEDGFNVVPLSSNLLKNNGSDHDQTLTAFDNYDPEAVLD